jgi:hypothetical protein
MKLQRRLLAAGIGTSRWKGSNSSSGSGGWQYIVELTEGSSTDIVLRRATAAEVKAAAAQSQQRQQLIANKMAGLSQVLEMLRDSGVPAVAHNLRFDIAFVMAAFVQSPLPKTWSGFRELVTEWFPGGGGRWGRGLGGLCVVGEGGEKGGVGSVSRGQNTAYG